MATKVSSKPVQQLKVAIVHDWLTNVAGAERVVFTMLQAYPQADIFTSVYIDSKFPQLAKIQGKITTSFLQNWPLAKRKHQLFPVLRTLAFESFDLSDYDVVISSTSAEAKGVITPTETLHISYINTPVRYYWSNYDQYLKDPGFGALNPLIRVITPYFVKRMRRWDYAAAQRPDVVVGNSHNVARRIKKYYEREAEVIHPPVDLSRFDVNNATLGDYYLVVSRLVPYKRYDLAVEACTQLGRRLIVVGDGPELKRLKKLAGPTVEFTGFLSDLEINQLYHGCKAFIFPGEEDFGITPLEAMACGKPVIAYGKGGATETVVAGATGEFFTSQTVNSLVEAMLKTDEVKFDATYIARHARKFGEDRFKRELVALVDQSLGLRDRVSARIHN